MRLRGAEERKKRREAPVRPFRESGRGEVVWTFDLLEPDEKKAEFGGVHQRPKRKRQCLIM